MSQPVAVLIDVAIPPIAVPGGSSSLPSTIPSEPNDGGEFEINDPQPLEPYETDFTRDDSTDEETNTSGQVSDIAPRLNRSSYRPDFEHTTASLELHTVETNISDSEGRIRLSVAEQERFLSDMVYRLQEELPKFLTDRDHDLAGLQDAYLIWDNIDFLRDEVKQLSLIHI